VSASTDQGRTGVIRPRCSACGYVLQGASRCSECGSLATRVQIPTPRRVWEAHLRRLLALTARLIATQLLVIVVLFTSIAATVLAAPPIVAWLVGAVATIALASCVLAAASLPSQTALSPRVPKSIAAPVLVFSTGAALGGLTFHASEALAHQNAWLLQLITAYFAVTVSFWATTEYMAPMGIALQNPRLTQRLRDLRTIGRLLAALWAISMLPCVLGVALSPFLILAQSAISISTAALIHYEARVLGATA